jgi:hypothetical protein
VDANPQLQAAQWTRLTGATNAPSAGEETEPLELDHRVAIHRCSPACSWTTPPTTPEEVMATAPVPDP